MGVRLRERDLEGLDRGVLGVDRIAAVAVRVERDRLERDQPLAGRGQLVDGDTVELAVSASTHSGPVQAARSSAVSGPPRTATAWAIRSASSPS